MSCGLNTGDLTCVASIVHDGCGTKTCPLTKKVNFQLSFVSMGNHISLPLSVSFIQAQKKGKCLTVKCLEMP